jgi:hypothetical protein
VYLPPERDDDATNDGDGDRPEDDSQWRGNVIWGGKPKGPPVKIGMDGWHHHHTEYPNGSVRLAGGYERVYDEDDENRPDGVGDEYTFDLSTL